MFSWIVDSIYLLKNLFFEDVILTDVVLYIGQIMVWFYLNAIYYVILVPFFYFIYGIYCLIKFVIFLPLFLITCVKSVVIFIVKVL